MKKIIITGAALITIIGGGYFSVQKSFESRCSGWLNTAQEAYDNKLYANVIEDLRLYFTQDKCRSKADPNAIALLAQARLHVPLARGAHVTQQLILSKLGLSRDQIEKDTYTLATSFLVRGEWYEALRRAKRLKTTEGGLVWLAAAVALSNEKEVRDAVEMLSSNDLTPFKQAMLNSYADMHDILMMYWTGDVLEEANQPIADFARYIAFGEKDEVIDYDVTAFRHKLSDSDLATATSLLVSRGDIKLVLDLLDQRDRDLPAQLRIRQFRLLWQTEQYEYIKTVYKYLNDIPLEVMFIECLAGREISGTCGTELDLKYLKNRYGNYAAGNWYTLIDTLKQPEPSMKMLWNAVETVTEQEPASAPLIQLLATVQLLSGEEELAKHSLDRLEGLGTVKVMTTQFTKTYDRNKAALKMVASCLEQENPPKDICWDAIGEQYGSTHVYWRELMKVRPTLEDEQIRKLEKISAKGATLWRLAKAKRLLGEATQPAAAEALTLLKPVLKNAPNISSAHFMAADIKLMFGDINTAFNHYGQTIEISPQNAVLATRLAFTAYQKGLDLSPELLVNWWAAFTWLELAGTKIKNKPQISVQFVEGRLMLLASYGEEKNDIAIAEAAYRKILEVMPDNHIALNNLAFHTFERGGDMYEAHRFASKAVKLSPNTKEYDETLAVISEALKEIEEKG